MTSEKDKKDPTKFFARATEKSVGEISKEGLGGTFGNIGITGIMTTSRAKSMGGTVVKAPYTMVCTKGHRRMKGNSVIKKGTAHLCGVCGSPMREVTKQ